MPSTRSRKESLRPCLTSPDQTTRASRSPRMLLKPPQPVLQRDLWGPSRQARNRCDRTHNLTHPIRPAPQSIGCTTPFTRANRSTASLTDTRSPDWTEKHSSRHTKARLPYCQHRNPAQCPMPHKENYRRPHSGQDRVRSRPYDPSTLRSGEAILSGDRAHPTPPRTVVPPPTRPGLVRRGLPAGQRSTPCDLPGSARHRLIFLEP